MCKSVQRIKGECEGIIQYTFGRISTGIDETLTPR